MFVAREKEISIIKNFLQDKGALLVYGLRRVGKTTLILEACKQISKKYVYFQCLKTNKETNLELFISLLKTQLNFINASFSSFISLFEYLNANYPDYIFVIDEYSLMKQYYFENKKQNSVEAGEVLDSEFQTIIDQHLNNINLILSGSSIHIMKQLTDHKSPLYGRFKTVINLKQFNYLEAKKMLPSLSNKDLISFYSVFGGSPYVLDKIDTSKSLKDNICELILSEEGRLLFHLRNNVINELENDPDLHDILNVIKNGSKKYNEIQSQAHITTAGLLSKKLAKLLELEIIEVRYPIGKEDCKNQKYYQIKDNLLKFYYAYIFRQDNRIQLLGPSRFYDVYIEPSIKEFISRRFESIVKSYFSIAISNGLYEDIIDIGTYFTSNNEFDCVLQKRNKKYIIYEVKFYSSPMTKMDQYKEIKQINDIKGLDVEQIGFVCSSGFKETLENIEYMNLDNLFQTQK